ncbi:hypothetical protein JYS44_00490 [Phycisphaeraceae bacterium AH-315-B13]|nr:hypothetical protein [Phycisphaeraceae bacterium AH-315-B13]
MHMPVPPRQERRSQRTRQRLALACHHLGNPAMQERQRARDLHNIRLLARRPACNLAHNRQRAQHLLVACSPANKHTAQLLNLPIERILRQTPNLRRYQIYALGPPEQHIEPGLPLPKFERTPRDKLVRALERLDAPLARPDRLKERVVPT